MNKLLDYFAGDPMPADVWKNKYALPEEETPEAMHRRMARELARIEKIYDDKETDDEIDFYQFSDFCIKNKLQYRGLTEDKIFEYFDKFKWIIPQGSIMSALGNPHKIQSLSNCFVIDSPSDSYGGIFKTDQQIAQLEKRRGGVGLDISTLRPDNTPVSNAAGTSTGAHSFMERFSNTTREVAQNGRRGALMLLIDCRHPDVFKFVTKKKDRTKVTGANVSVMLTDKFMEAVQKGEDFVCRFPIVDYKYIESEDYYITHHQKGEYNKLYKLTEGRGWCMTIKAQELFTLIVENAWENAEPGVAFIDRIKNYCPEGVYPQFVPKASNPCGEQWLQPNDACRLIAANLFSLVVNPWKSNAYLDLKKAYEVFYIQQRLADDIVDLEIEYVQKIIDKIKSDPEDESTKLVELELWQNVQKTAKASRRTGCGFTGLADMLAALGLKYDSPEAIDMTEKLMYTKMEAELDCTIDLAILRGTFEGSNNLMEYWIQIEPFKDRGHNEFYELIINEFPEQWYRMKQYGRRNVSWSTLAPTGSVSVVTFAGKYPNISSGGEPQFSLFHFRKRKVNPEDKNARVDETDASGDNWQIYPVVMGAFKDWYDAQDEAFTKVEDLTKEEMQYWYEQSPWFKATANDICWEKRIEMQAVIQKYTSNAISSTLNLPKEAQKSDVWSIYVWAWAKGLKGVTVYRDGCRDGVLLHEVKKEEFGYKDALKRPQEIDGNLHIVTVKGTKYAVIIGKINNKPYEIFAFKAEKDIAESGDLKGTIVKARKGHYNFLNCEEDNKIKDIQVKAEVGEEQMLTRMVSGMLRHGAKPQFVMEQIDKCDLEVVSFSKAISRVLKKYVKEEELISRSKCSECGSTELKMQEGCLQCTACGSSKCG